MKPTNILSLFLTLVLSTIALAQDEKETVLVLAQACVAEVDFDRLDECQVMWHINLRLAENRREKVPTWTLVDQLKAYNSAFKVSSPRTRWVKELNLEAEAPEHWLGHVPWGEKVDEWLTILEAAQAFVNHPGRHPCPQANAYGGNCFNNPHGVCDNAPNCWVQVVCHKRRQKPFAQAYYQAKRCSGG